VYNTIQSAVYKRSVFVPLNSQLYISGTLVLHIRYIFSQWMLVLPRERKPVLLRWWRINPSVRPFVQWFLSQLATLKAKCACSKEGSNHTGRCIATHHGPDTVTNRERRILHHSVIHSTIIITIPTLQALLVALPGRINLTEKKNGHSRKGNGIGQV
jgi:hypothetical protein